MNKYLELKDKLNNYIDNKYYERIMNLDLNNYIISKKILLNDSINKFLELIEYFYYSTLEPNSNILILSDDSALIINIIKYVREANDIFHTEPKDIKYDLLITHKMINSIKYDTCLIIGNINKIDEYKNIKLYETQIISENFIGEISDNPDISSYIENINAIMKHKLKIFECKDDKIINKLIESYENNLLIKVISYATTFGIPLKTDILDYYDNKMITIQNKLYSSINVLSFQFINYEEQNITIQKDKIILYNKLHKIASNLYRIKRAIDFRDIKKWNNITFQLDNFKTLGKYVSATYEVLDNKKHFATNAFLKMYEMCMTYPLIDREDTDTLKSFHFCEAPGMFIIGLNHFLQTKTKVVNWSWYGNSLTVEEDKTALEDNYGLLGKNKDRWLGGDIRKIENIRKFKKILGEVDLITSDCGICVDVDDLNRYEELIAETDFAQFINMLNLLKKGGSGIIKTFIPLELASNVCLIYMMTQVFETVYISKPITSRPQNSEVYLIGVKYLGVESKTLEDLIKILEEKKFDPRRNWIKEKIPDTFIRQLEDYIIEITRQQISYLLNIFNYLDNHLTIDIDSKEKNNQFWCSKFEFVSNNRNKLI